MHEAFNPSTFDRVTRRAVEMEITPDMARFFLSTMKRNRSLSPAHVEKIRRDVAAGRFEDNGETIKFYMDGSLTDGQHRLWACVHSGRSFKAWVIFGLTSTKNVDENRPRKFGDRLAIEFGMKHGKTVSAVLDHQWRWEIGVDSVSATPTSSEREMMLSKHPRIVDAVNWTEASRKVFRDSGAAFVRYLALEGGGEAAEAFFERVRSGANLDDNDPAFLVRERLMKGGRYTAGTMIRKDDRNERINIIIVGWNLAAEGRRVTKIQLPKNGRRPRIYKEDELRRRWNCQIVRNEPAPEME